MLFKILKGPSSRISTDITPFHEGYAYVTEDGGDFYVDMMVEGKQKRVQINPDEIPAGGKDGQLLTKTADGQEWKDREKDVLSVTITDSVSGDWYASNPAPDEILAAAQAGKAIELNYGGQKYFCTYIYVSAETGEAGFQFTSSGVTTDALTITAFALERESRNAQWRWSYTSNSTSQLLNSNGNSSDTTVTFTVASTRTALESGTKLAILMGKIAKWFNDLGWLAFKDTVTTNDVSSGIKASLSRADSALQSVSKSDVGLSYVANERQYSSANPPPYPVTSVNGKTGAVTVSVPTASTTTPKAPGTAAAGGETAYSRGDHVHPAEVFLATYNETTREEIMAAIEAGKQVFLKTDAAGRTRFALQLASPNGPIMFSRFQLPLDTLAGGADNSGWLSWGVVKLGTNGVWSSKPEVYKVPTLPHSRKVTLSASGWNSSTKQQTVTCSGVLSDATQQLLIPTPVNTAAGNPYDEASIQMVAQGANSVTFYADTVPTESIDVYVTIYPINYLG